MQNNKQTKAKYQCDEDEIPSGQRLNPESVLVDGDNLEVVKEFYYLGTVVTSERHSKSAVKSGDGLCSRIVQTMDFTMC